MDVKEILNILPYSLTEKELNLLDTAFVFAEKSHAGKKRLSGEPYINHPYEVAKTLAKINAGIKTIIAGLLHDTVDEGIANYDEMQKLFGKDIVGIVKNASELGDLRYKGHERHVESMRKFFLVIAKDVRTLLIRLADRLHNIETLEHVPKEKQKRIALETIKIYATLAHRLGMGKMTSALQDNAFPFAYPKEYKETTELLNKRSKTDIRYMENIVKKIKRALADANVRDFETTYRIKTKFSLYKKLQKFDMDIEKIRDIVAIRILVNNIEDCYKVLGIVHNFWKPVPAHIKDYIAIPKSNGYKSLHTSIFTGDGGMVEIQIRTHKMDHEANYGIASHSAYKEGKSGTPDWMKKLGKLINSSDNEDVLEDFLNDSIFALTPDGDVIELPVGSIALDFAYLVHSDIGKHAVGALINEKYSSLKTELKNGDVIKIETNKKNKPSEKLLDFVKTTEAKRHLRVIKESNIKKG